MAYTVALNSISPTSVGATSTNLTVNLTTTGSGIDLPYFNILLYSTLTGGTSIKSLYYAEANYDSGGTFSVDFTGVAGGTYYIEVINRNVTATPRKAITVNATLYTITYNANGATSGVAPSSQTAYYGNITLRTNTGALSKTNYQLVGWNTNSSGTGTNYAFGATYNLTSNITLYAKWVQYTLSFSANGGSGSVASIIGVGVKTLPAITGMTAPSPSPAYYFTGWNTNSSGTGTNYASGATYNLTSNITLYAKWAKNDYSIEHVAYEGGSTYTSYYNVSSSEQNIELYTGFSRLGYVRSTPSWEILWAAPTVINPTLNGDIIIIPANEYGAIEIQGLWTPATYGIYFDAGEGSSVSDTSYTYNPSSDTYINIPASTRTGYYVSSYTIEMNTSGGTSTIVNGSQIKIPAGAYNDIGVTFNWTAIVYGITIDENGGDPVSDKAYTILSTSVTLNRPTRTGYTFVSWTRTVDPTGGTTPETSTSDTLSFTDAYGPITYQAQWSANILTVSYDLNGGSGTTPAEQYAPYNSAFSLRGSSEIYKTGYTFAVWNTNSSGTGPNYGAGTSLTPMTLSNAVATSSPSITLYAIWIPVTYTITIDENGGNPVSDRSYTILSTSVTLNRPTRTGYTFSSWLRTVNPTDGTTPETSTSDTLSFTDAYGPITYQAQWVENTYNITWPSGSTLGGSTAFPISGSLSDTKPTTYKITTPTITMLDHVGTLMRNGWKDPVFNPSQIGQGSTGNITITIQSWTAIEYDITISSTGTGAGISGVTSNTKYKSSDVDGSAIIRTLVPGTKTGYTHGGWSIGTNTSGQTSSISGNTLTIPSGAYGNIEITQVFDLIDYNLTYVYSGSTNYPVNDGNIDPKPSTYDIETEITFTKGTLLRSGWSFSSNWISITGITAGNTVIPVGNTGDKTVTINWSAITYTITLVTLGTGASITSNSYITSSIDSNGAVRTLTPATRTGYLHNSWKINTNTSGQTSNIFGNTLNIPSGAYGNIEIEQEWTPITYTITFNKNNGDGDTPDKTGVIYDTAIGTLPTPTRTGYIFSGWWTGSGGTGTEITSTSQNLTSVNNATVTLYAKWTPITYTLAYTTNGVGSQTSKTCAYDSAIGTLPTLTKSGYTFNGWFLSQDEDNLNGTGTQVTNASINLTTTNGATVTVYAKWTATTYNITYPLRKHTGILTATITYITGNHNSPAKALAQTATLNETAESGWANTRSITTNTLGTNSSLSGNTLSIPATSYGNIIITAVWTGNTYTITYPIKKYGASTTSTKSYTVKAESQTVTIEETIESGWTNVRSITTNTSNSNSTLSSNTVTVPANAYGNITITTIWTGITYDINLDVDGGTALTKLSYTVSTSDQVINITNTTTKNGYSRNGWSVSVQSNGVASSIIAGPKISIPANAYGNVTVKIAWAIETYSYTINFLGGTSTHSGSSVGQITGTYKITDQLNIGIFTKPVLANRTLLYYQIVITPGQSSNHNINTVFTISNDTVSANLNTINFNTIGKYGSFVLTAVWSKMYYKVVFNANGGTGTMADQARELGDAIALRTNAFTRSRYDFVGWAKAATGLTPVYANAVTQDITKADGTIPTSTNIEAPDIINLYAKWNQLNDYVKIGTSTTATIKVGNQDKLIKLGSNVIWDSRLNN